MTTEPMKAGTELSNDPVLINTDYINELKNQIYEKNPTHWQLNALLLLSGKISNALSRKNAAIFLFPFRFVRYCTFILAKCKSFLSQTFCTGTRTEKEVKWNSEVEVKSAYEPSSPSGRCLCRFLYHEATKSIFTTSWMGCDSNPFQGPPPPTLNSLVPIYTPEKGTLRVKCLAQKHNTRSPARTQTQSAQNRKEIQKSNNRLFTQTSYKC